MGDTLTKNGFAMPEPFLGAQQFCAELVEGSLTKVLEFASLEQIPHSLPLGSTPEHSQAVAPDGCVWLLASARKSFTA